jgi:DNA-binding transcriptional ArsR family regulator
MKDIHLPHDHGQNISEKFSHMPKTEDFETVSSLFKQLGDSSRIRIFWILCHCEECVINISALMDMSSPAVSHHLKLLKSSGLIVSRREGKEVYYKAADTSRARCLHHIIEELVEIACPISETGR